MPLTTQLLAVYFQRRVEQRDEDENRQKEYRPFFRSIRWRINKRRVKVWVKDIARIPTISIKNHEKPTLAACGLCTQRRKNPKDPYSPSSEAIGVGHSPPGNHFFAPHGIVVKRNISAAGMALPPMCRATPNQIHLEDPPTVRSPHTMSSRASASFVVARHNHI